MNNKIYDFKRFRKLLKERKYVFQESSNYTLVEVDFETELKNGNIIFENNAIYYIQNNIKYKGYVSMYDYDINYKENTKYPSFHTVDCEIIMKFKKEGKFKDKYFFRNTENVNVLDRKTKIVHTGINLKICGYCKKITNKPIEYYTKDFYEELIEYTKKVNKGNVKLDSSGRPFEWLKMSKAYKTLKNYQCECCGFDGSILKGFDKGFIEVDHIIAWELSNLKEENLQSLCVLCHSQKDDLHRENYSKGIRLKKVKDFVEKYKNELMACSNPYIQSV